MTIYQKNQTAFANHHVSDATEVLALAGSIEARGAIFTRVEIVDFILDLVGYTPEQPLHQKRILKPSFGGGDFLLPIIGRLLEAWRVSKKDSTVMSGGFLRFQAQYLRRIRLPYWKDVAEDLREDLKCSRWLVCRT